MIITPAKDKVNPIIIKRASLTTALSLTIGFGIVSGQNQEKKLLDSLIHQFVVDTASPMGLHRSAVFLGLPINFDTSSLVFDDPMRMYAIINDTARMSSRNFKIASIIKPLDAWTVPFKYNGRYSSSLTFEKFEGKYTVGELVQDDTARWMNVESHVAKEKRKNAKLLHYGHLKFLHFPEIDEYNLFPLHTFYGLDTNSAIALDSPLKINCDTVRAQLKTGIIQDLKYLRPKNSKRPRPVG
jgi:hypothetical protein